MLGSCYLQESVALLADPCGMALPKVQAGQRRVLISQGNLLPFFCARSDFTLLLSCLSISA